MNAPYSPADALAADPLAGNPLRAREDFARAAVAYWRPLKDRFSPGGARVHLGRAAAHFTLAAAELEGFSRPLFGLAPLAAGGLSFEDWDLFRRGLAAGTDPDHPEYWGGFHHRDQRIVESAAIGFALLMAPDQLWTPLDARAKANVADWLKRALAATPSDNNWHFFHVLASLGLERCGVAHDLAIREADLVRLEEFFVGDGWYSDGAMRRFDHYVPFAMHFYGLVYAAHAPAADAARAQRFRERAAAFAQEFRHWFDADGAAIPFGRSMTYRFAMAAFWAGLAYAGVEALPWGEMRGLWARHLRWWAARDWLDRDGVMGVGFAYPNLHMSEMYNSPGSPYWAMKAYLPLALPAGHPFWAAEEVEKPDADALYASRPSGQVGFAMGRARVLLSSCNEMRAPLRCGAEKYGKFAYSSTFGFSVDNERQGFLINPFDNMLALSRDARGFMVRSDIDDARIGPDWLWSRWSPDDDVTVETWLIARAPWHLRAHKVTAARPLLATEGGFAIPRTDAEPRRETHEIGRAEIVTAQAASFALDFSPEARAGVWRKVIPSTNLIFPQTHVPHLAARLPAGETWLIGAFAATLDPAEGARWLAAPPVAPAIEALQAMVGRGAEIDGMRLREPDPEPGW